MLTSDETEFDSVLLRDGRGACEVLEARVGELIVVEPKEG
jgi:hypothetical protein